MGWIDFAGFNKRSVLHRPGRRALPTLLEVWKNCSHWLTGRKMVWKSQHSDCKKMLTILDSLARVLCNTRFLYL